MEENPYAHHLEGHDAIDIITATAPRLHDLFAAYSPDEIDRSPGPNKWSLRELMAHLADCEIVWSWRIRQTLAADSPALQPFDQDRWGDRYAAFDFASSQATYEALRAWNIRLLTTVKPADLIRPATHPERGTLTLQTILETIAGHDRHHIKLLEGLARKETRETIPSPS
jgi:uncharacterized damage-inducible protein DinB